jgi:hypothetical protein
MELSELLPQIGSEDPEKVLAAAQRVTQMLRAVGCSWSDLRVSRRRRRDPALRLARHAARERCRADELAALERAREIVRDCLTAPRLFDHFELKLLRSLSSWDWPISDRQQAALDRAHKKFQLYGEREMA